MLIFNNLKQDDNHLISNTNINNQVIFEDTKRTKKTRSSERVDYQILEIPFFSWQYFLFT